MIGIGACPRCGVEPCWLEPIGKLLNTWSHPPELNRRPADYESAALPAELGWPAFLFYNRPLRDSNTTTFALAKSECPGAKAR
jgi:hypothetical protein